MSKLDELLGEVEALDAAVFDFGAETAQDDAYPITLESAQHVWSGPTQRAFCAATSPAFRLAAMVRAMVGECEKYPHRRDDLMTMKAQAMLAAAVLAAGEKAAKKKSNV